MRVADTPETRARGLMHVRAMATLEGMLFVYEGPQKAEFWMRNTFIPLDMIFADARGVVRHIHANAIPQDETVIFGGDDIAYVVEINGGMADVLGIAQGDALRSPLLDQKLAEWPCPPAQ